MLLTLLVFAIILSLLVFVHELGHFLTAIRFGVKAEEFGFGLPPRAVGLQVFKIMGRYKFKWLWGNKEIAGGSPMVYSLNWLPIGGFVKIKGENGENPEEQDSFGNKTIGRRIIILAAGVLMNVLLAAVLLSLGYSIGLPSSVDSSDGRAYVRDQQAQIVQVLPGLPAESSGLKSGDVIMAADDTPIMRTGQLKDYLSDKLGRNVNFKIKRGQEEMQKTIAIGDYQGNIGIGVAIIDTGIVQYPWYWAIYEGFKMTFVWLFMIIMAFAAIIRNLLSGIPAGVEVSGPVGIAVMTSQAAKLGFSYLLQFAALLSLNLAIINILPFPALDGGRILFLIFEKIRGKAVEQKWENLAHNVGFMLLMCLVALITYQDVIKYGSRIAGSFKRMVGL